MQKEKVPGLFSDTDTASMLKNKSGTFLQAVCAFGAGPAFGRPLLWALGGANTVILCFHDTAVR
jgi:hypothetical protein